MSLRDGPEPSVGPPPTLEAASPWPSDYTSPGLSFPREPFPWTEEGRVFSFRSCRWAEYRLSLAQSQELGWAEKAAVTNKTSGGPGAGGAPGLHFSGDVASILWGSNFCATWLQPWTALSSSPFTTSQARDGLPTSWF